MAYFKRYLLHSYDPARRDQYEFSMSFDSLDEAAKKGQTWADQADPERDLRIAIYQLVEVIKDNEPEENQNGE